MSAFPSGASVIIGERGTSAIITIDVTLYSEDVALKAAYWLSERCHVHIGRGATGELVAEIRVKESGLDLTAACGEFCNGLVDFALRASVATETSGIQESLLKRAFSELLPSHG